VTFRHVRLGVLTETKRLVLREFEIELLEVNHNIILTTHSFLLSMVHLRRRGLPGPPRRHRRHIFDDDDLVDSSLNKREPLFDTVISFHDEPRHDVSAHGCPASQAGIFASYTCVLSTAFHSSAPSLTSVSPEASLVKKDPVLKPTRLIISTHCMLLLLGLITFLLLAIVYILSFDEK